MSRIVHGEGLGLSLVSTRTTASSDSTVFHSKKVLSIFHPGMPKICVRVLVRWPIVSPVVFAD
jgi:hypothetical protein